MLLFGQFNEARKENTNETLKHLFQIKM